jgi:hypothetical protein
MREKLHRRSKQRAIKSEMTPDSEVASDCLGADEKKQDI